MKQSASWDKSYYLIKKLLYYFETVWYYGTFPDRRLGARIAAHQIGLSSNRENS